MAYLYRIIDFPTFINLVENKFEWYANPDTWQDTYEGYWYQTLNTKEQVYKAVELLFNTVSINNSKGTLKNFFKLWAIKYFCFGQCWSTLKESDALWRIYSYGNTSIQIRTTDTKLLNVVDKFAVGFHADFDKVKYDLEGDNLLELQAVSIKNSKRSTEPLFHKRPCFKHEHEKRIIIMNREEANYYITSKTIKIANRIVDSIKDNKELSREEFIECVSNEIFDEIDPPKTNPHNKLKGYKLWLNEGVKLSDYITGVKVNPLAPDHFIDLVESLCIKHDLKFNGKSDIYAVAK